jgi:transposase-like protein
MKKYNRLSKYKIKKIIECFCIDIDATKAGQLLKLNRKTINRYYMHFRTQIYHNQQAEMKKLMGVIEVDESYFGARKERGHKKNKDPKKRGRGTPKQAVFGIFERRGRVYTELIQDASAATLQGIIRGKVALQSVINSDGWRGYNGLVDVGYDRHFRINHSEAYSEKGVHINGIESFWSFTKRRLSKFNGVKKYFLLHLKESEWRWNKDLVVLLKELETIVNF